jgi:hypothetical protein
MNRIRTIIYEIGEIPDLGPDDDLYQAVLSAVKVFLLLTELGSAFNVRLVDERFIAARTPGIATGPSPN